MNAPGIDDIMKNSYGKKSSSISSASNETPPLTESCDGMEEVGVGTVSNVTPLENRSSQGNLENHWKQEKVFDASQKDLEAAEDTSINGQTSNVSSCTDSLQRCKVHVKKKMTDEKKDDMFLNEDLEKMTDKRIQCVNMNCGDYCNLEWKVESPQVDILQMEPSQKASRNFMKCKTTGSQSE